MNVTVILAEPEHPGNIGSVCRVMANFGLSDLVLINPQCELTQETRNLAKSAQAVVDKIRIADWDVLKEFALVAATAGKTTTEFNIVRSPLTPSQAADKLLSVKGAKVAVLFGRESDGLTNAEIAKADFTVMIPVDEKYPSMNLSHAVAVVLAALYAHSPLKQFRPVPAKQKLVMYGKLDALLDTIPFPNEGKRSTQKKIWKSILGRAILTRAEADAAMGLFLALHRQRKLLEGKSSKKK